ncbi:MAG: carbohydrate-binding domain-containing protein [Clostridiales bacterium]|nr:carbohydrate-binding domain-containing protein [Clostridiales bacterium]
MKKLNKAVAAAIIFILVLGNAAVFSLGDTAGSVQEFTESFDINSGIYTETFASGRQFTSTVPEGGKTYDGVILYIPKDITATLTCDGIAKTFKSGEPVYGKGYYVLTAVSTDVVSGEIVSGYFTFRIMGEPVSGVYNEQYGCQMISCINSVENDFSTGLYKYTFPNCKVFFSSVSSYGENVTQASFLFPKNLGYSLKRNGSQISYGNNDIITAPGSYTMTVYAKNNGVLEEYARVYKTDFNFTIEDTATVSEVLGSVQSASGTGESSVSASAETAEIITEATTENIVSDTLTETYNADANLYKETFSNGEGFYTNIANNDLSGGNVYIDIPSNMTVTMTKDGIDTQFVNKTYIDEQGTYIFNVTSSSDGVKYRARFTFRIQKGVDASADAVTDEPSLEDEEAVEVFDENYVYEALTSASIVNEFDEDKNLFAFTVGTGRFYANMPAGMFSASALSLTMPTGLDYSVNKDGEEYINESENPDLYEESGSYTIFVSDKYGNSLEADFYLYSNPVNSFDSFTAPGGYSITSLKYSDYRDNYGFDPESDTVKFLEVETDEEAAETAEADETGEAAEETEAAEEEADPEAEAVKEGADLINMQIKRAVNQGLEALIMPLDGKYTIELRGDNLPALQTEIVVDKTAPVVYIDGLKANMKSTGNEVYINCYDEETTLYLFSKSGDEKILGEAGGSATVSGVGEYTLIAVDLAGNQTEYTFKITRHIGAAGFAAIGLLLVILIGIGVYMMYSSKKFSVR